MTITTNESQHGITHHQAYDDNHGTFAGSQSGPVRAVGHGRTREGGRCMCAALYSLDAATRRLPSDMPTPVNRRASDGSAVFDFVGDGGGAAGASSSLPHLHGARDGAGGANIQPFVTRQVRHG